ncbi:type I addiction module toxin, SymE family [Xanthomonas bromi]|nr:type I addiction module toxin, SymE family [Xanthomonas bromi]
MQSHDPDAFPQGPGRLCSRSRRARRPRQCTVSDTHYPGAHDHAGDQHVPHIRLNGTWLEQPGFAAGTKLRITASEGQLLMEVLPPVEVPAEVCDVWHAACGGDATAARGLAIDPGAGCH